MRSEGIKRGGQEEIGRWREGETVGRIGKEEKEGRKEGDSHSTMKSTGPKTLQWLSSRTEIRMVPRQKKSHVIALTSHHKVDSILCAGHVKVMSWPHSECNSLPKSDEAKTVEDRNGKRRKQG